MKDKLISVSIWVAIIAVCGFAVVGFSFVVGKVAFQDKTASCGLVRTDNGQCLDGKYIMLDTGVPLQDLKPCLDGTACEVIK